VSGESVDVATELADLIGQLGADRAQSLLDGGDLFGGLPSGGVVGGDTLCQLRDLGSDAVAATDAVGDGVDPITEVGVAGGGEGGGAPFFGLIAELADSIAQAAQLGTELRLGADTRVELRELATERVDQANASIRATVSSSGPLAAGAGASAAWSAFAASSPRRASRSPTRAASGALSMRALS